MTSLCDSIKLILFKNFFFKVVNGEKCAVLVGADYYNFDNKLSNICPSVCHTVASNQNGWASLNVLLAPRMMKLLTPRHNSLWLIIVTLIDSRQERCGNLAIGLQLLRNGNRKSCMTRKTTSHTLRRAWVILRSPFMFCIHIYQKASINTIILGNADITKPSYLKQLT